MSRAWRRCSPPGGPTIPHGILCASRPAWLIGAGPLLCSAGTSSQGGLRSLLALGVPGWPRQRRSVQGAPCTAKKMHSVGAKRSGRADLYAQRHAPPAACRISQAPDCGRTFVRSLLGCRVQSKRRRPVGAGAHAGACLIVGLGIDASSVRWPRKAGSLS